MPNSKLVYSTEAGRICPECQKPVSDCTCGKKQSESQSQSRGDGIIRIRREVKGRKGKTVTIISGFDLNGIGLGLLAKQLKQHCGAGGSVKDGLIIIQGDHREKVQAFLAGQGHTVKLAGG
jgi:translation initiation factor 1